MKYFYSVLIFLLGVTNNSMSQAQTNLILNTDSANVKTSKFLQRKLVLSEDQTIKILNVEQIHTSAINELNQNKSLTIEERGRALKRIQAEYLTKIQSVLTTQQWQEFQQLRTNTKNKFINKTGTKKITVKEIGE